MEHASYPPPVSAAVPRIQAVAAAITSPAAVYLARLAPGSRRTMRAALATIAGLLTDGTADCFALPWSALRYQHTAAVCALLAERYAPVYRKGLPSAATPVFVTVWP